MLTSQIMGFIQFFYFYRRKNKTLFLEKSAPAEQNYRWTGKGTQDPTYGRALLSYLAPYLLLTWRPQLSDSDQKINAGAKSSGTL